MSYTPEEEAQVKQDRDDQFILAQELVGGNIYVFPDTINSRRYVRFLRMLRKHSPIGEGDLAARCGERIFLPEWQPMVDWFVSRGYVALKPKEVGRFLELSLTDKGEDFCNYKLGPKEPVKTQPTTTE